MEELSKGRSLADLRIQNGVQSSQEIRGSERI